MDFVKILSDLNYFDADDCYRDFYNNFLTIQGFADWHHITTDNAEKLIQYCINNKH